MYRSIGILEVRGMTAAIECIDQMTKNAFVEIVSVIRSTGGLMTVLVSGDLASVQAAIEIGLERSMEKGAFYAMKVIPRPYEETFRLLSIEEKGGVNEIN